MLKKRLVIAFLALILSVSLVLPQKTWGADNYTHDADIYRDNTVVDSTFNGLVYNNNPYYIEIPQWHGFRQYSFTTPVVVGNQLWQYTFDDTGYGHLWEIDLQKPPASWTPGSGVTANVTLIQDFNAGATGANGDINAAGGVSGPTISNGYLAIAVGYYLYWWPIGHPEQMQSTNIQGNSGNSNQFIAASPLITPNLTATGTDINTGNTVTWQTTFAVVGSWSGGVISQPIQVPNNVLFNTPGYMTTKDASNATNDIVTSSPAWNPRTSIFGSQGAAVFGVDAVQSGKYRLILLDPITGDFRSIYESGGSPIFYGPIDSSPAVIGDSSNPNYGMIFVPDQGAAVYAFNWDGGYISLNTSAMDQSSPCISNIAVDGKNVIWVGNGHTTLNVSPIDAFSSGTVTIGSFNGLDSPAVVNNGSSETVFLASTGMAGLMVTNPMNYNNLPISFQQNQNTWQNTWQTLGSVSPSYTSVAADVGTDSTDGTQLHFLTTWTNYGYETQGCVEIWAPSSYSLTATATPGIVNSGDQVIITAYPNPTGVTQSMTAQLSNGSSINMVQWNNQPNNESWQGVLNAPNNYTGSEVQYTVTITATNKIGQTAIATCSFTVEPIPLPPPGNLSGTLNIVAYRRSGATQPAGTAKYGDNLVVTLTVPTPPPPSGLMNAQVTGARLTKAWVHTPKGVIGKDGNGVVQIVRSEVDTNMTLDGLTATCQYPESWAGYPPPIPDNTVMETNNIYAPFSVHVDYKYQVPVPTKTGVIYVWRTGSYDASGNASTYLNITGTEWYIYNEAIKDSGTPVWEP